MKKQKHKQQEEQKVESISVEETEVSAEEVQKTENPAEMTPGGAKTEEIITTYRKNLWSVFFKRFFDIVLSLLGLIILSPLFIVVSLIVFFKLDRKVFFSTYRSYRIGRNNKVFKLLKFSTMKNNLFDENGNLLPDKDRVSKFGNFLRKTSIDELPQLINILKGDMSLIGPRPRIIEECVFLDEDSLRVRGLVRPGITGLAQINGRNNISFTKVVEYDKQYIKTIGFWTDLKIFFKTIGKVLKKSDINKDGTVSNEFFGDMLLRTGEISQEEYDKKQIEAREIINKAQSKQPKQA